MSCLLPFDDKYVYSSKSPLNEVLKGMDLCSGVC
jgi:hypothetical protein